MNTALMTLAAAAQRAPSGDNTQPWRFIVDEAAGRIALQLDPARDPSPMNAGQRMARIACGAALENMVQTAAHHGWDLGCEPPTGGALAQVRLLGGDDHAAIIPPAVAARVTNRRLYDGRAIAPALQQALQNATPAMYGVRTDWIADRRRLPALADLIGRADAVMFGDGAMRRAFLANVCFDRPAAEPAPFGLSLGSLELSAVDRLALRSIRRLPDWAVRYGGCLRQFAAHGRRLAGSASGLCLGIASDRRPQTDVAVGRAMQRAWLALTEAGLAVQPMMSLLVLEGAHERHGCPTVLATLRQDMRALLPEIGVGRPAFLLRFGYAPPPSGRTGRLPRAAVTSVIPASPAAALTTH